METRTGFQNPREFFFPDSARVFKNRDAEIGPEYQWTSPYGCRATASTRKCFREPRGFPLFFFY